MIPIHALRKKIQQYTALHTANNFNPIRSMIVSPCNEQVYGRSDDAAL
jgi:hypothetical protein